MKGLIRKEFYLSRGNFLFFSVISLVFFVCYVVSPSHSMFFISYPALLLSIISTSSMQSDEMDRWNVFAAALPCSKRQLVSVKFIIALAVALVVTLSVLIVTLLCDRDGTFLSTTVLIFLYSLLTPAINLMASFKWRIRKSRIFSLLLTVVIFVGLNFGIEYLNPHLQVGKSLLLAALGLLIFFALWHIASRAYQHRDL